MQRKPSPAERPPGRFQTSVYGSVLALAALALPLPAHADEPWIGEVVRGGYNFFPKGSLECNGQAMALAASKSTHLFQHDLADSDFMGFTLPHIVAHYLIAT